MLLIYDQKSEIVATRSLMFNLERWKPFWLNCSDTCCQQNAISSLTQSSPTTPLLLPHLFGKKLYPILPIFLLYQMKNTGT